MIQNDNTDIQDLESSIEHWMLSNPNDFESTFGKDLASAVSEEIYCE